MKTRTLKLHGGKDVWIETGTYLGQTTLYLSKIASEVHTIEPSSALFEESKARLLGNKNIYQYLGTSQMMLEGLILDLLKSRNNLRDLSFWLDGHYSSGETFKGPENSPIKNELEILAKYLPFFNNVSIFIDDLHLFKREFESDGYPTVPDLISWSEKYELSWLISNNIFIAKKHI